jgi:hypothetical protein
VRNAISGRRRKREDECRVLNADEGMLMWVMHVVW